MIVMIIIIIIRCIIVIFKIATKVLQEITKKLRSIQSSIVKHRPHFLSLIFYHFVVIEVYHY